MRALKATALAGTLLVTLTATRLNAQFPTTPPAATPLRPVRFQPFVNSRLTIRPP